jgi:hypothetical protein
MKRTKKDVRTPWLGLPVGFSNEEYSGFVYSIVNTLTQQIYIGKKSFWAKTRKKVKGKKRRRLCVSESNWQYYKSSSDDLKYDIEKYGLDSFTFEILSLHKTRAQVNYAETRELFIRDVLTEQLPCGAYKYYNRNIMGRWFRGKVG